MSKRKMLGWCAAVVGVFILVMKLFTIDWNDVENAEKRQSFAPAHYEQTVEQVRATPAAVETEVTIKPVYSRKMKPKYRYIKGCTLTKKTQRKIFKICKRKKISYELVMAVIEKESGWNSKCVSDGGKSIGLMQIQGKWHRELMDKLQCNNLYNPIQNVEVGTSILVSQFKTWEEPTWVLMAYNGGPAYAKRMIQKGITSEYAKSVMKRSRDFERSNKG